MTFRRSHDGKARVAFGALLGALVLAAASCADSSESNSNDRDSGSTIPSPPVETKQDAGGDGDGGCDAGGLGCDTPVATCDDGAWCPVTTPLDARLGLGAVWGTSASDVWAVGAGGTILHFDGATWNAATSGTSEAIYAIWGSSPTDLWAVSSTQKMLRSTGWANGSATWTLTTALAGPRDYDAVGKNVRAVWGTSTSDVMIAGESFKISYDNPPANRWRATLVGGELAWAPASDCVNDFFAECPSIFGLSGTGPNDRWAVGTSGYAAYATSVDETGTPNWTPLDSQSTDDLQAVWSAGPGEAWAVGRRGTIRHRATGAERFSVVDSGTQNTLRAVWGSSPNDVWAVGDAGTVLHFDGTAWSPAAVSLNSKTPPTLRGVWGSRPDDVWAVGDGIVLHFTGKKDGR